jgi:cytochrome c biogenesis protein CcdA
MDSLLIAAVSAFWLGILTSISPCPLATNIAAVSFIGRQVGCARDALLSGILYTAGRMLAYIGLGFLAVAGIFSIPAVSNFLQDYMDLILGPFLLVVGVLLLNVVHVKIPGFGSGEWTRRFAEQSGIWSAIPLGIIFALSLCPVSAGLFFGSLVPLSFKHKSYLLLPSIYGMGTGIPVAIFGILLAFGAGSIGKVYERIRAFERWARAITALTFMIIGMHLILRYQLRIY